jgi:thiol-disulfide isomerase/thioredoxin
MTHRLSVRGLVLWLALFVAAPFARTAELPKRFRLEAVLTSGLTEPSSMDKTADGRILIAERTTGNLRVVVQGELQALPLCTVGVISTGEAGLLGVAAHPQFLANGWAYLYYTDAISGNNKVTRFTVSGSGCGSGLDIATNLGAGPSFLRNGGGLAFSSDGKLYIGAGDVETSGNGQNDATLFGKILRVNDDGSVPSDNPTPGSLVYAKGIRDARGLAANSSGNVYALDVGQGVSIYDEVNRIRPGGNYGWDLSTGNSGGAYDDPLAWYSPVVGIRGLDVMGSAKAFPNLNADGIDNNENKYGADGAPGVKRVNDNGALGQCYGGSLPDAPCTSDANCPPRNNGLYNETARCQFIDDAAEYCGPTAYGDDLCGASGTDEPEETALNNVFFAAESGNKIFRGITNPSDLTQLVQTDTFLDSSFLAGCPDNWTDVLAGNDGFLYALARNTGAATGGLYRVIYDDQPGPREVSAKGSHFPLRIDKSPGFPDNVIVSWEDLRSDSTQPRDDGNADPEARLPRAPAREYAIWKGTLGTYYSHAVAQGFAPGTTVNEALRRLTLVAGSGSYYFLVSGRHANLEGTLGKNTAGVERPGYPTPDKCTTIGFHTPVSSTAAAEDLWKCGKDFTVKDEYGQTHSLYEYREQVVLLDFSGVWCPPCQAQADVMESLYQLYKDRGVVMLTILMDEDDQVFDWSGRPGQIEGRDWSDRAGANPDHTFPCWLDPNPTSGPKQAWPLYNNFSAIPTNVILDTGLRVVYSGAGYDENAIKNRLNALVGSADACLQ